MITASLMGLQFVKDDFSERLAAVGGAVKSVLLDRKSTKNDFVGFYSSFWGLGFGFFSEQDCRKSTSGVFLSVKNSSSWLQ